LANRTQPDAPDGTGRKLSRCCTAARELRASLGEFRVAVAALEHPLPLLRALGEDRQREATALELIPGLVGSPIYREG